MQNSYLKTFDNLFYNVDEHKDVKEIIGQATEVLGMLITRFGEIINEMATGVSRKDDFVDTVIILFVRKIMEQLDAINVLYSVGSFESTQVILRSLIENIVALEFILKEDTEKRAAAYYLEHHYQEVDKGRNIFNEESKYRKIVVAQKGKEEFEKDLEFFKKKESALKRLIKSNPIFSEIDTERKSKLDTKRKKQNKKKIHIQWYEVCSDIKSVYGLMKETGYEEYYDGIYGGLSFESHGLNATMGMSADEKRFMLKWIRNPEGGGTTFELVCAFSIGVLHKIYRYLEDGESEIAEFRNFFLDFVEKRDTAARNLDAIRTVTKSTST